jgi:uncharacterized Fe-S cluster protein YjdI
MHEYSNGEVTIIWDPQKCTHACFCWRELPEVFNPAEHPWIKPDNTTTDRLIAQVERCPSGALLYRWNNEAPIVSPDEEKLN